MGTGWWGRVPEVPKAPEGTQLLALAGGWAHATPGEGNPWGKMVFSSSPPQKTCHIGNKGWWSRAGRAELQTQL